MPITLIVLGAIHTMIMRVITADKKSTDDLTNDLALIYFSCLGENDKE